MQLELFSWQDLSASDKSQIFREIKNHYWHLRNLRAGRFGQAASRRYYRKIAEQKKRLQLGGVDKREILDFLSCCRLKCESKKPPRFNTSLLPWAITQLVDSNGKGKKWQNTCRKEGILNSCAMLPKRLKNIDGHQFACSLGKYHCSWPPKPSSSFIAN